MSQLLRHLRRRIAVEGPITVAQYMEDCLVHPKFGYYTTRDPFGMAGDFVTAPEISQMFGELIGVWTAHIWQDMGRPNPFNWIELGPGRGTLSADALRVMAGVNGLLDAIRVHLVEVSPELRNKQSDLLCTYAPQWHNDITDLPSNPGIVIANEFFDALPICQYQLAQDGWHERVISMDDDNNLCFALSQQVLRNPPLPFGMDTVRLGDIIEVPIASLSIIRHLRNRLMSDGGAALIIDYGHQRSAVGDTLQAMKGQAYHDILELPGEADLTAHVDFQILAETAREVGVVSWGPIDQGVFLQALGINARAERLMISANSEQYNSIHAALRRLTGPDSMGSLFKVMALTGKDMSPPPAF